MKMCLKRSPFVFLTASLAAFLLLLPNMAEAKALKAADVTFPSGSPCVSDNAKILDKDVSKAVSDLNAKWEKDADGAQLAVVTVDSLPSGETIEDYSMELAEKVKPGQKGKDNGLLYLIVKSTRQDRLEVGYGLEDKITDSEASDILDGAHVFYKRNDYSGGVNALIYSVDCDVAGSSSWKTNSSSDGKCLRDILLWILGVCLTLAVVTLIVCYADGERRRREWLTVERDLLNEWERRHPNVTDTNGVVSCTPRVVDDEDMPRSHDSSFSIYLNGFDDDRGTRKTTHSSDDDGWSRNDDNDWFNGGSSSFGGFGGGFFGGGGASGSW